MDRNEVFKKIEEIFKDVFDKEIKLSDSTTAKDIEGWDSLTHITLMAEIEDTFEIKFSMKQILCMKNVGEMVDIILEEI